MGVWIEIPHFIIDFNKKRVTPFMGVWIEIGDTVCIRGSDLSHPLWVCGLK